MSCIFKIFILFKMFHVKHYFFKKTEIIDISVALIPGIREICPKDVGLILISFSIASAESDFTLV